MSNQRLSRVRVAALTAPLLIATAVAAAPTGLTPGDALDASSGGAKANYGVATSVGAASYGYTFELPPARHGVGPSLGVYYSSASRVAGTIAEGWSLGPLPSVRRDVTRETGNGPVYVIDWGDGPQELLRTSEPSRQTIGLTFRPRYDSRQTRVEAIANSLFIQSWVARTPDGRTYYFGETPNSHLGGDWRLTRVTDRWGNTVTYTWWPVYASGTAGIQTGPQTSSDAPVDLALAEIDYTTNPSANQSAPYARVRLLWNYRPLTQTCSFTHPSLRVGSYYPAGSASSFRTGTREVSAFWRLEQVISEVQPYQGSAWTEAHEWNLGYDNTAELCGGKVSPRRRLISIGEVGVNANNVRTSGPTVTLSYGTSPDMTAVSTQTVTLPASPTYYGVPTTQGENTPGWPDSNGATANGLTVNLCGGHVTGGGFYSMLIDLDGDGLPDLLRTDGRSCQATWYKNNGPGSSTQFGPAATFALPPAGGATPGDRSQTAGCSLNGAWFAQQHIPTGPTDCPYLTWRTHYDYRWVDVDGNGKVDLVLAGWGNGWPTTVNTGGRTAPRCTNPVCTSEPGNQLCSTPQDCRYAKSPVEIGSQPPPTQGVCQDYRQDGAQRCGDGTGYAWVVYHDIAELGLTTPEVWCSPVALADNPRDPNEPQAPAPASDLFDLVDMDGDGIVDIVSASVTYYTYNQAQGLFCPAPSYGNPYLVFNVFFGDGHGNFTRHELWSTTAYASQCEDHQARRSWLVDMNGDGLPDLVHEAQFSDPTTGSYIWVSYNNGHGFDSQSSLVLQPSRAVGPSNGDLLDCPHNVPRLFADVDGDGVMDIASMYGDHPELSAGIAFGHGGGFFEYSAQADALQTYTLPGSNTPVSAGRTAQVWTDSWWDSYRYSTAFNDVVDLDGNGVRDRVQAGGAATSFQLQAWSPSGDSAPGLLSEVNNGRGGIIRYHYARTTDRTVVDMNQTRPAYAANWSDWIAPALPTNAWVVKAVEASADGGSTFARTDYHYADPVSGPEVLAFASDGIHVATGRAPRLHGFQSVTTTMPLNSNETTRPQTFDRFSYRLAGEALADYHTLKEWDNVLSALVKRTVDVTTYTSLPMFDSRLRFVTTQSQRHIECQPSTTDSACDGQQTFTRTTSLGLYGWPATAPAVYTAETQTTTGRADTSDPGTARYHTRNHIVIDAGGDYLLLPKRDFDQASSSNAILDRTDYFYDGSRDVESCGSAFGGVCRGALTMRRSYRKAATQVNGTTVCDGSVCDDHGGWYDNFGNPIRLLYPPAMIQAQDDASNTAAPHHTFTYDGWSLVVTNSATPTGQTITRSFDIKTGKIVDQTGPNMRVFLSCGGWICIAFPSYETTHYEYDGIGRLTTMGETRDEGSSAFVLHNILTVDYASFPSYYATEHKALGYDAGATWVNKRMFYDGFDRAIAIHKQTNGLALSTQPYSPGGNGFEYTTYMARGEVATEVAPHPDDDTQTITVRHAHDARGRVLATVATPANTATVFAYAPLTTSIRDADGGTTVQKWGAFGELLEVDQGTTTIARTYYDYDGLGRLAHIRDADGNTTAFGYDDESNRTGITRPGNRSWSYVYGADGQLAMEVDPDNRATKYFYDASGRVTDEYDYPNLTTDQATQYGIGRVQYVYDTADTTMAGVSLTSRAGRLATVNLFAGTNSSPYTSIAYGYDGSGRPSSQVWNLNFSQTGARSFGMVRTLGPLGLPLSTRYPNGQTASWSYDTRGQLKSVTAAGYAAGTYTYTLAGMLRSVSSFGSTGLPSQQRTFHYDSLGRHVSDQLAVASATPQSLSRTYHYRPGGDMDVLGVNDQLSDGALTTSLGFSYDDQHRLATAALNTTTAFTYNASLTYKASGSVDTATITGNMMPLPDRVGVRHHYDPTGNTADVHAVTSLDRPDGTSLATYTYDKSGNMTSRWVDPAARNAGNLYTQFAYDTHGQIRRVDRVGQAGSWEQYYYDYRHQRFLTLTAAGWRLNIDNEFELEHDYVTGDTARAYVAGVGVVAQVSSPCADSSCAPQVTLLHQDRRGDTLAVVDAGGAMRAHFIYGAFGETLYSTGATGDVRWQSNDKEHDGVDQLAYYGYRYYDPLALHWTTQDPLVRVSPETVATDPQRLNPYEFSRNNPLSFQDPTGLLEGAPEPTFPDLPIPPPERYNPGKQPFELYIGNHATVNIAREYIRARALHMEFQIYTNFYTVGGILKRDGNYSLGAGLTLKPDILNWDLRVVYEIKPYTDYAGAKQQLQYYIKGFASAGVQIKPGAAWADGTYGYVSAPGGFYVYWTPEDGIILYKYYKTQSDDIDQQQPVPMIDTRSNDNDNVFFKGAANDNATSRPVRIPDAAVQAGTRNGIGAFVIIGLMILLAPIGI
jgi:RHS repeat-associated protein